MQGLKKSVYHRLLAEEMAQSKYESNIRRQEELIGH